MSYKLEDICVYVKEKIDISLIDENTYISTENMLPDRGGITEASSLPSADKTQAFNAGDVLVSNIRPYFKKIWFATFDGGCSNDVLVFRAKEGVSKHFLYYVLADDTFFSYSMSTAKGTKMPRGDKKALMKYDVPNISYEEQVKIASVLDAIDKKIIVNEEINDNLYEQLTTYYKHLFASITSTTSVGEMADNIYSGGTPSTANEAYWNGDHYWLSSGETSNRFIVSTIKTITDGGITNSSTRKANKYDIAIASAGQGHTRGQTSMLLTETYVNQSIIVVHANGDYLPFLFWNIANRYEELRVISNSNSIRGSLTTKMISSLNIPKTDAARIKQFSDYAWPIIKTIENNLNENQKLTAIRDIVLPKLMSGELDVSNIDI